MEDAVRKVVKSHSRHWISFLTKFCENPNSLKGCLPSSRDGLTCNIVEPEENVFTLYLTAAQAAEAVNAAEDITDFPFLTAEVALQTLVRSSALRNWDQRSNKVYGLNTALLSSYHKSGTLGAASFGHRYLIDQLDKSIAEITIQDEFGDQYTGSGVVVSLTPDLVPSPRILTCKHNLYSPDGEPYQIIAIKIGGETFDPVNIFVCSRIDACCVVLDRKGETLALPIGKPHVLLPIITAGFPRIKMTQASPLLFHSGEINGIVGEQAAGTLEMVISCNVAPGTSGGPVLSEYGEVIGLVHERVETASITGMANYGMAIPVMQIVSDLSSSHDGTLFTQDYRGRL